ncbi:MAG TPA: PadR family transcriptional regulator [Solirubrobacterales bacterium]|jgi:DNA-binding PadR family transcriptional regulator|nr:PadR family transcriptional regulator [Solirubrobacterales bacterium]
MRGGWGRGYGERGHRARRGDVRSAILALLNERSMHGYEMIQELEERTGGRWRPSAGSIYPTLQLLEDEGLVKGDEVEGKRVFSLTDSGREAVEERAERKAPWENGDEDSPRFEIRAELMRTIGAAKQVARGDDDEQMAKAAEILKDARKSLYGLLAEE